MSNLPMTALLGVAAVVGPLMLAVLAQSEDRANATKQCVGEKCPITTQLNGKKPPNAQAGQKTLDGKSKNIEAMVSIPAGPISCGDGRAIVAKRFNSVRVIRCKGSGAYTYIGRRKGASFRILVDRHTGRIIGRTPI